MQWLHRVWHIIRWPLGILFVLYIGIVIYSVPHALEKRKTEETVTRIHAQKLTIENVNGEHLPPPPDPAQVDATVEGIDANMNGIRDDVELAIFEKYPNSAKIRAAELQYAMALQMEFTQVFNPETLVNAINEEGRGFLCIANDSRAKEVENLVANTPERSAFREQIRKKYMASFGLDTKDECDLNPTLLLN